ncbi:MAG: hypothetical protein JST66_12280 [Bacteroidetes bacterium]|nr:hypothetical protein [Bacteroidota bacterium]
MDRLLFPLLCIALAACAPSSPSSEASATAVLPPLGADAKVYAHVDLPNQDDNVKHDTLLIYTTHALGNGTFVMAARNMDDTREGLRLFLYRPRPDSTADVIAASSPAYDSYTMLPTFFTTGDTADGTIILANLGEKQSWGQKVFWLKDGRFTDLGFIDAAERERRTEDDSTFNWYANIAPRVDVRGAGGRFDLTFHGDSVMVYDDLQGGSEVLLPASRIAYRYDGTRLLLVIDGRPRLPHTL